MTRPPEFFASCASPVDLMKAAGVEPISLAIETWLDAATAAPPTVGQARLWPKMSRQPWPTTAAKRLVQCAGRGSTKTTAGAWLSVFHALCVDHDAHAAPGSRIYHACIAPKRKQAAEAVRIQCSVLDQLHGLGVRYEVTGERSDNAEIIITAPKRRCTRVISVWSQEGGSPRGFAFCFLHALEFGHWQTGADYKETDVSTLAGVVPRLAQFPRSQALFESTPGAPSGMFFDYVTAPPVSTLVARGSTFFFNPNILESEARAWVPDERQYRQEILAEVFGHAGDGFLDPLACERCLDLDGRFTGKGPRSGHFVEALDLAQVSDAAAFVVVSTAERVIDEYKAPVRFFVVEHVEAQQGSRTRPLELEQLKSHAIEIARAFPSPYQSPCSLVFDQYAAIELKRLLRERGFSEATEPRELRNGSKFLQMAMTAPAQTARWRQLREVVHGGRLRVPATPHGRALVNQLAELRAWELPGGLLRVEGKHDDIADACALAVEIAVHLSPTDTGGIEVEFAPVFFTDTPSNLQGGGASFYRRDEKGRRAPCEPPYDPSPGSHYEQWAIELAMSGHSTPSIERWKRETGRGPHGELLENGPITHVRVIGG